jgi:hypothetical protein
MVASVIRFGVISPLGRYFKALGVKTILENFFINSPKIKLNKGQIFTALGQKNLFCMAQIGEIFGRYWAIF